MASVLAEMFIKENIKNGFMSNTENKANVGD